MQLKRAHHSMPRQSMPTSKPNDMKHILILILCAFVLSCKSTKTISSSNESERNAVSQVQWRSAQNLSFSTLQRLTALSFDSCVFTFGGADTSATPQCSDISYPSGKPLSNNKAKPSTSHGNATDCIRGEPYSASRPTHGKPSSLRLYGLHLSQEEKEESAAAQQVEDSIATAKQSSSDKSQDITKSRSSVPFTAKLTIAVLMMITAAAVLMLIRRYHAGRRKHFGRRLPNSSPDGSGGALLDGEDKPLHG